MKNKILQLSLLLIGIMMLTSTANSQNLMEYTVAKTYENPYVSISSTGNVLMTNPYMYTYSFIYETDARLGGFTFRFEDYDWNRFGVLASGIVTLHGSTRSPQQCGVYTWPYYPIHYYYNDHNYIYGNMCVNRPAFYLYYSYYATNYYQGTGPSYVKFEVQGAAPNRVLVIEWENARPYDINYYNSACYLNFQLHLHEGSGVFEYKYGPKYYTSNFYYNYYDAGSYWYGYTWYTVGVTGCNWVTTPDQRYSYWEYINIYSNDGTGDLVPHYTNKNPEPWYSLPAIRNIGSQRPDAEAVAKLQPGLVLQFSAYPAFFGADPYKGQIFRKGNIYTDQNHPGIYVERSAGGQTIYTRYNIGGPLPKTSAEYRDVYTAHNPGRPDDLIYMMEDQPVGKPGKGKILTAKGICAGPDGEFDLQTNQSQIIGGEYVVEAEMILVRDGQVFFSQKMPSHTCIIALDNDIQVSQLLSPISKLDKKYPLGSSVPLQTRVMNIGINNVSEFDTRIQIFKDGSQIQSTTQTWQNNNNPLRTGQYANIVYQPFIPTAVGDYKVVITTTLRGATDQNLLNNVFPRANQAEFYFNVAHEIDGLALEIITPKGTQYLNRPFIPQGKFANNGVSDMSDVPASCVITDANGNEKYRSDIIIEDISTGKFNTRIVKFGSSFIPTEPGTYTICISINSTEDPLTSNNQLCESFTVVGGLQGNYTIGRQYDGQPRNFSTMQSAVDALFGLGITGSVTFELTDETYEIGAKQGEPGFVPNSPALDLSSGLIGVGPNSTITFKPSRNRMVTRGGITLNLNSDIGIGILMGQNATPNNTNAPVLAVNNNVKNKYANNAGYITFDGGNYKAFKFRMITTSNFQAPFYLMEGSQNLTIANCIIENLTPVATLRHATLPLSVYDASAEKFKFEQDKISQNTTYSAGIVMRSVAPVFKQDPLNPQLNTNSVHLDTIPSNNNKIVGNDISGFGYGIVSIGMGPMLNFGKNELVPYYNYNNTIANNVIYNVARAGIFAGFENGSVIKNNRIYNVTGIYQPSNWIMGAAGIIAGGESKSGWFGYNNMNLNITGNEISQITSENLAQGIRVQQFRIPLTHPVKGVVYFPNGDENTKVTNNIVWGLAPTNAGASKVGIYLLTERKNMDVFTPFDAQYFTKGDKIANNTIYISEDNIDNAAIVAGIGVQNSMGVEIVNNALAMLDQSFNLSGIAASLICYQGIDPEFNGIKANRNAFWNASGKSGVYRYMQIDENSNILEFGNRDEFVNLGQWQQWTGQEAFSVYGDFTRDLTMLGTNPTYLRVTTSPQTPIGSILNNRGERLSWLTNDVDGNARGEAGQNFDIGASEFNGRQYLEDIEVEGVYEPGSYKATSGMFSDAEYIMTKAPIEVKARLRNNSSLLRSDIEVTLRIYRELPGGQYDPTPVITETSMITIQPNESASAIFRLADGQGAEFYPETYGDLRNAGFNVPLEFQSMKPNVTPKYRIAISIGNDQLNGNNTYSKEVRFYLKRSSMDMLISAEHSNKDISSGKPTVDYIAGKLNFTYLLDGLDKLGWYIDFDTEPPRYDYDVFERSGWEPKSVKYSLYRSIFWTDANDKALTRYEREDIRKFFNSGNVTEKKNLIIGSQDMARETNPLDPQFLSKMLRIENVDPGNPLGKGVTNDGNQVIGVAVAYNRSETIKETGFTLKTPEGDISDVAPYCGLIKPSASGEGVSRIAYRYKNHKAAANDSAMAVVLTTVTKNVISLGVDWRHFANIELILRGLVDYVEANGGNIVAAELLDFNARQTGEKVEVTWATASETNSSRFDIERAQISSTGRTEFEKIDALQAAGTSTALINYGPVIDRDVVLGGKYVYRLKMVDRDGQFEYSPERTVVMTGADGLTMLGEALPNPAVDNTRIDYSLSEATNLKIALYDVTGKQIQVLHDGMQSAGKNVVNINVKDLTSGSYTVVFSTGNATVSRKLTVVR